MNTHAELCEFLIERLGWAEKVLRSFPGFSGSDNADRLKDVIENARLELRTLNDPPKRKPRPVDPDFLARERARRDKETA